VQKEMDMTKTVTRQEKRFLNIINKEEIHAENMIMMPVEALSSLIRRHQKNGIFLNGWSD
jgi:hypothetical protein